MVLKNVYRLNETRSRGVTRGCPYVFFSFECKMDVMTMKEIVNREIPGGFKREDGRGAFLTFPYKNF